ncbi:signal transduction histidine kinase [Cryptosporangium arvum DSM 44712]|uniref:histidine kinase n=1 Tax=Cryptosporangium arvum DSM 44712 TaxID=927661 RepID=A0A010Z196_9ACTN|nr:signal transduction histidine kinase [Cryptosporangium arvum DSM 44712]
MQLVTRWARDTIRLVGAGLAACLRTFGLALSLVGVGLVFLDATLAATVRAAARRQGRTVSVPRLRARLADPATWRAVGWQAGLGLVLLPAGVAALVLALGGVAGVLAPVLEAVPHPGELSLNGRVIADQRTAWVVCAQGVVLGVAAYGLGRLLVAAEAALASALLRPSVENARIAELTESRAQSVRAAEQELRRIERDLHDGAQAHLVAVALDLGLVEQLVDDERARRLVAEARAGAAAALEGLREIVHGIHPPVLAERGLAGGVQELALAAALPVEVEVELPGRPPAPVESALYFTVAELLTNAARHAGARRASVVLRRDGDAIRLTVRDDGHGGARPRPDGGIAGLRRRLAAFDGQLAVTSPVGGPTIIEVSVPCES